MSVVDDIKSRLDIVQYISRTVPLKRAGRVYKACCPFHSEKTPSFTVDPQRQSWRCFGACATGGDVFTFAMRQQGWTFAETLQELGKLTGVEVQPRTPQQAARDSQLERLRGLVKSAAEYYHERLLDAGNADAVKTLAYARGKRGLTDETIQKFMIGYAPTGWTGALEAFTALGYSEDDLLEVGLAIRNDNGRVYDRFRNRLMIPICDERGRVVGFGARALAADDNPKYLNSPQTPLFDKSRLLFALDLAGNEIRQSETVVIVEGYLDAIQAHQAGYSNVVAQMGTALTDTQLKLVAPRWAKRIILALDSDAAGQNATMRSLEVARQTLQLSYKEKDSTDIRILTVPDAKDPDDLIREKPELWADLVSAATPVVDYVIDMEVANLPQNATEQEREAVARKLLPILLATQNKVYQKENIQKLARKLRILGNMSGAEKTLIDWANEQEMIAALKAPRIAEPPPSMSLEDPFGAPPDEIDSDPEVGTKALVVARSTENGLERDCLRILIMQPDLLYAVNRKLRELAQGDEALLGGCLNDLCLDDFSRTQYRMLADAFNAALEQDDIEPVDHMRRSLDGELLGEFESLVGGDLALLQPRLRHGLSVDLETVVQVVARSSMPLDAVLDATNKMLKLRLQRLQRERQEILYLQMENEMDGDYNALIFQSALAKGRIEVALREQNQLNLR